MGILREDQKVNISFKIVGDAEKVIGCSIKNIQKDRFALTFPNEIFSYTDYLQVGEEVLVKVFSGTGMSLFNSMILSSPLESEFVLEYPDNYTTVQRRAYPRKNLETKIIIEREKHKNIVTHTLDIGGGGVRFVFPGIFLTNEAVFARLYLPNEFYSIKASGSIIKQPHLPADQYVMLFSEIEERDREKIIKKCYKVVSDD